MIQTLLALALAFLLMGTAGGTPAAAPASGEPIRLGAISSLTGSFATFGSMERAGYALAVDDINTAGGINGRPLLIDLQDDTSNANTALTVAEQFIRSGVPLVLGAYSSSITKPLAVYMARQRVPLLNSNSADDSITKPGSDYVFRVGQNTDAYVKPFFALFKQLGTIKSIAILVSNNALGHSVENSLLTQAKDGGYPVVVDQAHELFARLKAFMGGAEPSYHAIRAYAGATVAADALRRAATLSPEGIRAALQTTSLTTPFGTVEFKDFSGFHNQNPLPSILMQVQHRAYVTVWPLDVAVGKVIYPTPVWTARK